MSSSAALPQEVRAEFHLISTEIILCLHLLYISLCFLTGDFKQFHQEASSSIAVTLGVHK